MGQQSTLRRPVIEPRRPSGHALEAPQTAPFPPRLALDADELGELLGVSGRTIRDQFPDIPRIRRGRSVLYPVSAVERWLAENARPDEPAATAASDEGSNDVDDH